MEEFQSFIQERIRKGARIYIPLAIFILIATGVLFFALSQLIDEEGSVPRGILVFPLMFPLISVGLVFQWFKSLNVQKHPLYKLLFEDPSVLRKIAVIRNLGNVGNYRVEFVRKEGGPIALIMSQEADVKKLTGYVQQHINQDIPIEGI